MTNSQEQALIKLYKAMTSADIERRLAASGLTQLARGVAENELMQRRLRAAAPRDDRAASRKPVVVAPKPAGSYNPVAVAFLVMLAAVVLGVGWLFMRDRLPLFFVIAALLLALSLGKAFPWIGMTLGVLSLGAAIAIPIAAVVSPARDPAESLLRVFFGSIAVLLLLAVGAVLIHGARVSRRERKFAACMARPGYPAFEEEGQ